MPVGIDISHGDRSDACGAEYNAVNDLEPIGTPPEYLDFRRGFRLIARDGGQNEELITDPDCREVGPVARRHG